MSYAIARATTSRNGEPVTLDFMSNDGFGHTEIIRYIQKFGTRLLAQNMCKRFNDLLYMVNRRDMNASKIPTLAYSYEVVTWERAMEIIAQKASARAASVPKEAASTPVAPKLTSAQEALQRFEANKPLTFESPGPSEQEAQPVTNYVPGRTCSCSQCGARLQQELNERVLKVMERALSTGQPSPYSAG